MKRLERRAQGGPPWIRAAAESLQSCPTPQTAAHQAPVSLGFSRQEHWSGLPFPPPNTSFSLPFLSLEHPLQAPLQVLQKQMLSDQTLTPHPRSLYTSCGGAAPALGRLPGQMLWYWDKPTAIRWRWRNHLISAVFTHKSWETTLKKKKKNDFVYFLNCLWIILPQK